MDVGRHSTWYLGMTTRFRRFHMQRFSAERMTYAWWNHQVKFAYCPSPSKTSGKSGFIVFTKVDPLSYV